ncbi:MAG: NAD(P)/FAD-dependent oxidoreductase [Bacteroidota bacterium]|nr:NAD(P)/FAD-dependent oxidoreductase [Bacteroidota bacterium]
MTYDLIVIGAGAGGCFTAIRLAEFYPGARICILEAARKPLSKVEISGGGRCNVTHACFDPDTLTEYYPRGSNELLSPFQEFHPGHLIDWFRSKGVKLKTEEDGRVFPVTDRSSTIIDCFLREMQKHKIELRLATRVADFNFEKEHSYWNVKLFDGQELRSQNILIASGSDDRTWKALKEHGHHIISLVPSLFTFNIKLKELTELMGVSKSNVSLSIPSIKLESQGPLLITHWGMSGPAILKLSAWGARELSDCGYVFDLQVNWTGSKNPDAFMNMLNEQIIQNPKRQINKLVVKDIPARLWKYLCDRAQIPEFMSGAEFGRKPLTRLTSVLTIDIYRVTGKSTFKEEFVTAGGVDLADIDMAKFESKIQPGLFLVGEVLNIDAITGGFNFQAAWTGAHMAARGISEKLKDKS